MAVVATTWVEYATHLDTSPTMGAVQNPRPWIQMFAPNVTQCINQAPAPTIVQFINQPIAPSTN